MFVVLIKSFGWESNVGLGNVANGLVVEEEEEANAGILFDEKVINWRENINRAEILIKEEEGKEE